MPITEFLVQNAQNYPDEAALIEINPAAREQSEQKSWKEFALVEPIGAADYRREITWKEFDEATNRFANLLIQRGMPSSA